MVGIFPEYTDWNLIHNGIQAPVGGVQIDFDRISLFQFLSKNVLILLQHLARSELRDVKGAP